jgi:hypothetical protein
LTNVHTDTISAIRWFDDGASFVVTSLDHKIVIYVRHTFAPASRADGQNAEGEITRQLNTPNVQVSDFVITPDQTRLVLAATVVRRRNEAAGAAGAGGASSGAKAKPAMSGRSVHDPMNGISSDPVDDFGYDEMEHYLVVMRREDNEVVE